MLLSEKMEDVQSDPDEMENLRRTVSSITEERDQLKTDLEENVEMVSA